jgi:phosphoserine aminotransferase
MLDWATYAGNESMYNTPPCYTIYVVGLVLEWIKNEIGGLANMKKHNEKKAAILYDYLDNESKLFRATAEKGSRSMMNVCFVTGDADKDKDFAKKADAAGFVNLKGHRSVGGMRASIYNAMPIEGVEKLVAFMREYENA